MRNEVIESGQGNENRLAAAIILLAWAVLCLIRWTGPSDLLDSDQKRPAAYTMDAARNGHWICQMDDLGEICSKPPLYTWSAAFVVLAFGRGSDVALALPSALAGRWQAVHCHHRQSDRCECLGEGKPVTNIEI